MREAASAAIDGLTLDRTTVMSSEVNADAGTVFIAKGGTTLAEGGGVVGTATAPAWRATPAPHAVKPNAVRPHAKRTTADRAGVRRVDC